MLPILYTYILQSCTILYPLIEIFLLNPPSVIKDALQQDTFHLSAASYPASACQITIFCTSLRSFKSCDLASRVPRSDRKFPMQKSTQISLSASFFISSFLSSRAASGQVLSAFVSLTSVFGMDTGDPHSCRHCFSESLFSQNHIEEVLKLFACLGVSKLRPRPISFMSLQALRFFHS